LHFFGDQDIRRKQSCYGVQPHDLSSCLLLWWFCCPSGAFTTSKSYIYNLLCVISVCWPCLMETWTWGHPDVCALQGWRSFGVWVWKDALSLLSVWRPLEVLFRDIEELHFCRFLILIIGCSSLLYTTGNFLAELLLDQNHAAVDVFSFYIDVLGFCCTQSWPCWVS
jgi:hypothetical protein